MKKLIIPFLVLFLLSCEDSVTLFKYDWDVTVSIETQQWDNVGHRLVRTEYSSYHEEHLDKTEKEIKEYCVQKIFIDTYGNTMYKHITSYTYKRK